MSYAVSLTRCPGYDAVDAALAEVLAPLGGLGAFVRPGQRVLLKLNLLLAKPPEAAVTTHPALVQAVVRAVQALGATAVVGDSPGLAHNRAAYDALLRATGIQQVVDETGCEVVFFDDATCEVAGDRAKVFKKLTVSRAPVDADVVIGLPKLKTHGFMYVSGAVKLLYGYLPGLTKMQHHLYAGKRMADFAELLLDIAETLPPALSIMDAVVAMEGNGPSHGTPRDVGLLLASPNAYALDFLATHLIGLDPLAVPSVAAAASRGIGPKTLDALTLHGADPAAVRVPDFAPAPTLKTSGIMPPWVADLSSWLFAPRPVIDAARCIKCGKCASHCPPGAITQAHGAVPTIDLTPCLRCFCCHELCPEGAVHIAPARLGGRRG
jgi:uncharacterized protein (DUF362 family)/Pyruvate/2-oxoacid:ferredoxin oxidoreductase delta subunit